MSSNWWQAIADAADPQGYVRRMGDGPLVRAIGEMAARPQPNRWQAEAWAMCVSEAARRFAATIPDHEQD